MKKYPIYFLAAFFAMAFFSSCQLIGDIFKAGVWSGVLLVVAVIGIIIYLVSSVFKRK